MLVEYEARKSLAVSHTYQTSIFARRENTAAYFSRTQIYVAVYRFTQTVVKPYSLIPLGLLRCL